MYKKLLPFLLLIALISSCSARKTVVISNKMTDMQKNIIDYGMKYLNKPYRYAGKGPNSFDCSGFTSFVFKEFGYELASSSAAQGKQFPMLRNREELQKGDLVFFEGRAHNGRVGHVGIVTETGPKGEFKFIHASTGRGVIISSSEEPYYASRYLHGSRVLNEGSGRY